MIIHRGLGFLVFIFVFGFALVAELSANYFSGNDYYWDNNRWVLGVALMLAGLASWFLGKILEPKNVYRDDKATATPLEKPAPERFSISGKHSLFFIRMQYWGPILWVISIILIISGL